MSTLGVLLPARLVELDRATAWYEVRRLDARTDVVCFVARPDGGVRVVTGSAPRSDDPASDVALAVRRALNDVKQGPDPEVAA